MRDVAKQPQQAGDLCRISSSVGVGSGFSCSTHVLPWSFGPSFSVRTSDNHSHCEVLSKLVLACSGAVCDGGVNPVLYRVKSCSMRCLCSSVNSPWSSIRGDSLLRSLSTQSATGCNAHRLGKRPGPNTQLFPDRRLRGCPALTATGFFGFCGIKSSLTVTSITWLRMP